MANQKMYLPPHRRPSSQPRPSTTLTSPSQVPRESLFEGTILGLSHLHLHPLSPPTNKTLIESQSVRRGHGRFGAPSETTLARSITAVVSQTDHNETIGDQTEEDLHNVSALYSQSTNLARSIITNTSSTVDTDAEESSTRAHTPLPTREWTSVDIRAAPLPPKPTAQFSSTSFSLDTVLETRPLADRIGEYGVVAEVIGNPRPLVERIGGLYIPPGRQERERDDNSFWQSQATSRNDNDRFRPRGIIRRDNDSNDKRWQSEVIRRQRRNFNKQPPSQPGPSRRCLVPPSYTQIAVLFHSLGEKVTSAKLEDLDVKEGEGIDNVVYAGSYKWIESDDGPTLAVPAVPDIWDPPEVVGKLVHDKDIKNYEEFPDYASALLPLSLSTLEPLFLSLTSPDVLHDVDLVTGRNNLRKLWSACRVTDNHHTSPWRIDIDYIDCGDLPGIVILERFESPTTHRERVIPNGYRQSYQEATTRKVLDGSDRTPGCNRIIKYNYGGLLMLVKFDTPAFQPSKSNWTEYEKGVTELFDNTTNDGVSTMDGLDFDDPVYNGQSIRIRHTNLTPPSQMECLSIKTKHYQDHFDAEYHYPQMYFSQTPRVIYAKHQHGDFKFPIEEYNLFEDLVPDRIEKERQEGVNKVASVLRWVVGLARNHEKGLGLVWDGREFGICERIPGEGKEVSAPVREMIMDVRGRDRSVVAPSVCLSVVQPSLQ